jgi:hypothetical protein
VTEQATEHVQPEGSRGDVMTNALVGYQVATNIYIHEANRIWSRFQAMLAICTFLATASGGLLLATNQDNRIVHSLSQATPAVGALMTIFWLILHHRGDDYMDYFLRSARELEVRYLRDQVKTLDRGIKFSRGQVVNFELDGADETQKIRLLSRPSMKHVSTAIIVMFFLIFVVLLAL